jgi:nucleotide-binding universal stress UspA family protein
MLKKILVALDGSASSAMVLDQALLIARASGAQLMLLHVLEVDEAGQPLMTLLKQVHRAHLEPKQSNLALQQRWQVHQTQWETQLQAYVQQALEAGVKAEYNQSYGNPGYVICDWAWTWDADLIILGRQGKRQGLGLRLGSVSHYVSQNAQCSVMMVASQNKLESGSIRDYKLVEI